MVLAPAFESALRSPLGFRVFDWKTQKRPAYQATAERHAAASAPWHSIRRVNHLYSPSQSAALARPETDTPPASRSLNRPALLERRGMRDPHHHSAITPPHQIHTPRSPAKDQAPSMQCARCPLEQQKQVIPQPVLDLGGLRVQGDPRPRHQPQGYAIRVLVPAGVIWIYCLHHCMP